MPFLRFENCIAIKGNHKIKLHKMNESRELCTGTVDDYQMPAANILLTSHYFLFTYLFICVLLSFGVFNSPQFLINSVQFLLFVFFSTYTNKHINIHICKYIFLQQIPFPFLLNLNEEIFTRLLMCMCVSLVH